EQEAERRGGGPTAKGGAAKEPGGDALEYPGGRGAPQAEEHDRIEQVEAADGERAQKQGLSWTQRAPLVGLGFSHRTSNVERTRGLDFLVFRISAIIQAQTFGGKEAHAAPVSSWCHPVWNSCPCPSVKR